MKVVYLTAGAAGMYCGSCMHDNALAKAMRQQGIDCVLQPVYTPIRTDAESVADDQVFFGGIHIYLLQQFPWLQFVPAKLLRGLNWPPLIRWATTRASSTDAAKLGELSVSMLRGVNGRQRDEVRRIVDWFSNEMKPDAVLFTNLLIGGALPQIRAALPNAKLCVLLQGDDIFLDHLPTDSRNEAIQLCSKLINHVDHIIVHSRFYANKMSAMLSIPENKIVVTPLSIDLKPFDSLPEKLPSGPSEFRLGYLARIAPEKGLHHLIDAFIQLARDTEHDDLSLHVAGWLGNSNHDYLDSLKQRIADAGLESRFTYHGSPSLSKKVEFMRSLDLFSVPTDYHDPKGLFVLESLAAGVPVVLPDHGAFGELVESTQGGTTFVPGSVQSLCDAIAELKSDPNHRKTLASIGEANVREKHSIELAASDMRQLLFDD